MQTQNDQDFRAEARKALAPQTATRMYDIGYPMRELARRHGTFDQPAASLPDWERLGYPSEQFYNDNIKNRVDTAKQLAVDTNRETIKVVLWGDDSLKPRSEGVSRSVIGVDFFFITIDGSEFKIWDTAGQQRFKNLSEAYVRGARVVVIFANNQQQFDEIKGIEDLKSIKSFLLLPYFLAHCDIKFTVNGN